MYKYESQISLSEFYTPFGKLNPNNRWGKIAQLIPWDEYEPEYAAQFDEETGAPATPFRMALGTLIIKQQTGHSDEEILQNIMENPYMQFLIGLMEFTEKPPFCSASITNFRKYISKELIDKINYEMFNAAGRKKDDKPNNDHYTDGDAIGGRGTEADMD
jgi:hypothetical protein